MIIIKKLEWSNCFSYGENNSIDLISSNLTQLVGLNGAGKSSIPLILEEVFYNKNSIGKKKIRIPNRFINKGYSIRTEFSVDSDEYIIEVVRKASIKVKLLKNGEDISSHTATNTYKTVQKLLGLEFKIFSQLIYQSTNAALLFLSATDTNRKKFLIELLQLGAYTELFEIFKAEVSDCEKKLNSISSKIEVVKKWLELNNSSAIIVPEAVFEPNLPEEKQTHSVTFQNELKNISSTNKKLRTNNQYKALLDAVDMDLVHSNPGEIESYDQQQTDLGDIEATIRNEKSIITKFSKLKGVCPTCEGDIDEDKVYNLIQFSDALIDIKAKEKTVILENIAEIKTKNIAVKKARKAKEQFEDLFMLYKPSLPTELLIEEDLKHKIKVLIDEINKTKKEIRKAREINEGINGIKARKQVIEEQELNFNNELETLEIDLEFIENRVTILEVLKKSFSTNGLLAYKIENLVKDLEELTNKYLSEFSDGRFNIQFVVVKDKLNVEIIDNGEIVDIKDLSSGEISRVTISTLLAIRKLMSSISKSRINILFLDEVTTVLDEAGKEKLVEVLLKEDLNTFIVSHGWTHPLLDKIEVIKENNISRLEK